MLKILSAIAMILTGKEYINEKRTKEVPTEYWENIDAYTSDVLNGVPHEQRMKKLHAGMYKMDKPSWYQEPHKDIDGKIIIENNLLYQKDIETYGAVQAQKWVQQGKYNLSPEELEKEKERIKKRYEELYRLIDKKKFNF